MPSSKALGLILVARTLKKDFLRLCATTLDVSTCLLLAVRNVSLFQISAQHQSS